MMVAASFGPSLQPVAAICLVPNAANDSMTTQQDVTKTVAAPGVLVNDTCLSLLGSGLSAVLVSDVSHGVLTLQPNGGYTYDPDPGYSGADQFRSRHTFGP